MTPSLPYVPAADVVPGIDLMALPDGYTPLAAIVLVKTLDPEGDVAWLNRYAKDLGGMESLGALHAAAALVTEDIKNSYRPEGAEDD